MNSMTENWKALKDAWKADLERRDGLIPSAETDFLPAALEVIQRPVSPTARVTTWVLLIGLFATIVWTVFGRLDVVASAPGTLMPTGNVKLVQSPGSGVVRAIYVRNGDVVKKGQALIELDPTLSGADLAQAEKALAAAELDAARNRAIADALAGKGVHFMPPPGASPEVVATQRALIAAQLAQVEAAGGGLSAARDSAIADADGARAQVAKLNATIPILEREIENMNRLDAKGYAPGLRLLELQRQKQQEVGEREAARAQISRGLAEARKSGSQSWENREQARRTALLDLAKAEAEAILRSEEVKKASQKRRFQRLLAPEDGTIQQLDVHTVGGVVEPARTLMVLVPARGGLFVEARILNRDIGFVRAGQGASVKLEAFPFTRYGAVPGRVRTISRDAIPDKKLGSVYVATIALDTTSINADGSATALSPGLAATVDIHTGTRRIISYLLSPIQATISQAAKER